MTGKTIEVDTFSNFSQDSILQNNNKNRGLMSLQKTFGGKFGEREEFAWMINQFCGNFPFIFPLSAHLTGFYSCIACTCDNK